VRLSRSYRTYCKALGKITIRCKSLYRGRHICGQIPSLTYFLDLESVYFSISYTFYIFHLRRQLIPLFKPFLHCILAAFGLIRALSKTYRYQGNITITMSALPVPQQQAQNIVNRSPSSSQLRPIEHNDELAPTSRSRRNSATNSGLTPLPLTAPTAGAPTSAAAHAGLIPLPSGPMQATAENNALIAPIDWKEPDQLAARNGKPAPTTLYVGKDKKPAHLPTELLKEKSPYFRRVLADSSKTPSMEQTAFEDIDEFGMALFMHWLNNHGHLQGPHDFHSLAHYLSLYVLSRKFEIEGLENQSKSSHNSTLL
jgi:hypothetical protein